MRAVVMRDRRLVVDDIPAPVPGPGEVLVKTLAATLRHIADGKIPTEPLITGKIGLEGVPPAFEELASPERHAKILVEPWRK